MSNIVNLKDADGNSYYAVSHSDALKVKDGSSLTNALTWQEFEKTGETSLDFSVVAGTSYSSGTLKIPFYIPTGKSFYFYITSNGCISKFQPYRFDINGNSSSLSSATTAVDSDILVESESEIYGIGIYVASAWCIDSGTITITLKAVNPFYSTLANAANITNMLDYQDVSTEDSASLKFGSLYRTAETTSGVYAYLFDNNYYHVSPNQTIQVVQADDVTVRIVEYSSAKKSTYLRQSSYTADMGSYTVGSDTNYVRISASYANRVIDEEDDDGETITNYCEDRPITTSDYVEGDFYLVIPDILRLSAVEEDMQDVNDKVMPAYNMPWDDAEYLGGYMIRNKNFMRVSNSGGKGIAVDGASTLEVLPNSENTLVVRIAFLTDFSASEIKSEIGTSYSATYTPAWCDGETNFRSISPSAGLTELDIPTDCKYIWVLSFYKTNALPLSLKIDGVEYLATLSDRVDIIEEYVTSSESSYDIRTDVLLRNQHKDNAIRSLIRPSNMSSEDGYIPKLGFIHVSDIHTDASNYVCMKNLKEVMDYYTDIQFAIITGDIVNEDFSSPMTGYNTALNGVTQPILHVIGNHDAGQWNSTDTTASVGTDEEIYAKFIEPYIDDWGLGANEDTETYGDYHPTGKNYYFKDFTTQEVRLIVLYEYESYVTDKTDEDQQEAYPEFFSTKRQYRQMMDEQIEWLVNDALGKCPDDYGVIVAYHMPEDFAEDDNDFVAYKMMNHTCSEVNYPWYSSTVSATSPRYSLLRIFEAFRTHSTLDAFSITQYYGDEERTLNFPACDFSEKESEFICILCGHTHNDYIGHFEYYPNLLVCCVGADNIHYPSQNTGDCSYAANTMSEDLINVVAVNRNNKTVNIVRIGRDSSSTGQDRRLLTISYDE